MQRFCLFFAILLPKETLFQISISNFYFTLFKKYRRYNQIYSNLKNNKSKVKIKKERFIANHLK